MHEACGEGGNAGEEVAAFQAFTTLRPWLQRRVFLMASSPGDRTALRKLFSEVTTPTLGQGLDRDGPPHQLNVTFVSRVQTGNIRDRDAVLVAGNQLNLITGLYLAFTLDREVKPGSPAHEKSPDDIAAAKLDAQLITGHTRLSDLHLCGTQAKAVADAAWEIAGANATPVNTITYENVGVILKVTPFITSDGSVEMILAPQISSLSDQTVNVSAGVNVPVINIRSADTVVVTPNGETVIIGGLMQTLKGEVVSKIPFLGDIPGIGLAFRRTQKTEAKTELIIFLTPHIVSDSAQLASLTSAEKQRSPMVQKALTEKELNQFLDNLPNSTPPGGTSSGRRKSKGSN
jgi:hypothetical protein